MSGTDFVFDKFLRTCDVCGTPRTAKELRLRDGIAICIRHPGYRTAKELDKLNAVKRIQVPPLRRGTRPLAPLATWEVEESRIFDLIVSVAPFETFDTTSDGAPGITGAKSYQAAGWAGIYLGEMIVENKRPTKWLERAETKLVELADYFVSNQNLTAPAETEYGAFSVGFDSASEDLGVGAIALIRAYQATGARKYIVAARFCANAIVNFLAMETNQNNFPALTRRYAIVHTWNSASQTSDNLFYPAAMTCMWALKLLIEVDGDASYGATAGGDYAVSPTRLASVARDQIRSFWETGVANTGTATVINGLSAATPREAFSGTTGNWSTGTFNIDGWATGVRCLYEAAGATAQVTGIVAMLQALTQRAATMVPAGYSTKRILTTTVGTFDPTVAPPITIDPVNYTELASFYDFASAGLLAPVLPTASLEAAKEALSPLRPRTAEGTPRDGRAQSLGRLGRSGFSFQPWSTVSTRRESVTRAAKTGLLYRVNMAGMGSH